MMMATKSAHKSSSHRSTSSRTSSSTGRKSTSGKTTGHRNTTRKYSPSTQKNVETEMREMKQGKLKSGRSGKKVTNPKQAVAIGLSKARKEGKKVPAKRA